ncbi:MAG: hypothetical protein M1812_004771 [Candelaria pacifica]|nr:MAG: hypothetical protein M1812_004771 [Candelaria pacifica]
MTESGVKRRKLSHGPANTTGAQEPFVPKHPPYTSRQQTNNGDGATISQSEHSSREDAPYVAGQAKRFTGRPDRTDAILQSQEYNGGTFKSNMFRLQVDELLAEVRPDSIARVDAIEEALRKIKGFIEAAPDRCPMNVLEAENQLRGSCKITVPFAEPRPTKDAKYRVAYLKPKYINVVGSYVLKTFTKTKEIWSVDLLVSMPKAIFDIKDFMNYRYFHKKAYYVACIAAALKENIDCKYKLSFAYQNGNPLQPMIIVKSNEGLALHPPLLQSTLSNELDASMDNFSSSTCEIHILTGISEQLFPMEKILPGRNCIRSNRVGTDNDPSLLRPTPFYNATICAEASSPLYLKFLHEASDKSASFREACILGRTWLQQREIGRSLAKGGFGHFEWAVVSALLLRGGGPKGHNVLSHGYSSYQLFKATLQFLASRDLITKPLLLMADNVKIPSADLPMLFDGDRGMNVLFKMTPWSYRLLRHEAHVSVEMLNDPLFDHFDATFIKRISSPMLRFDALVDISLTDLSISATSGDYNTKMGHSSQKCYEILSKGLGDRTDLIHLTYSEPAPWSISNPGPTTNGEFHILAGLLINAMNAGRTVDHGPSVEDKKGAIAFRKFWGERAELRRFKDGSILESIIWTEHESRASLIRTIVVYLLTRQFGVEVGQGAVFVGDGFEPLLLQKTAGDLAEFPFQPLMTAFEILVKALRALEGMPLQLRQIFATSPALRYSSINAPNTLSMQQNHNIPADVIIQFEGSGRWPDDISAIQRTKIAFLLKIADLITASMKNAAVRIGLENEHNALLNGSFLEIKQPTGFAFRLRIHNEREQTLLERELKSQSLDVRHKEKVAQALSAYKRAAVQQPLHTQAVHSLCTRHLLLSPTIRLTKKWFDCHLLSTHFAEELIELIVIHIFVHPYPWQEPSSLMTGFLRTLHFLSRWNWHTDPLIVDFNGELTTSDTETIHTQVEAWRKVDPGMNHVALLVASKLDLHGIAWTERRPSKVVAARMTSLARFACKAANEAGLELDPASLFTRSTADYDFVIYMKPNLTGISRGSKERDSGFKNLRVQPSSGTLLVGYNPIELFFDEIQSSYGANIIFFRDVNSNEVIAGLWNPQTGPRPWKVHLTYSVEPSHGRGKDEEHITINKLSILDEITRLGGELIDRIDVIR